MDESKFLFENSIIIIKKNYLNLPQGKQNVPTLQTLFYFHNLGQVAVFFQVIPFCQPKILEFCQLIKTTKKCTKCSKISYLFKNINISWVANQGFNLILKVKWGCTLGITIANVYTRSLEIHSNKFFIQK